MRGILIAGLCSFLLYPNLVPAQSPLAVVYGSATLGGGLGSFDRSTASWAAIGSHGLGAATSIDGLAYDPSAGALYASARTPSASPLLDDSFLYLIDQVSGSATLVGLMLNGEGVRGLAWDTVGNALLGVTEWNTLCSFDTNTGACTGSTPITGATAPIRGLAYDTGGDLLYGIGSDDRIVAIDKLSGAANPLPILLPRPGSWEGLCYDTELDVLWAVQSVALPGTSTRVLHEIDPHQGTARFIGTTSAGPTGLAFKHGHTTPQYQVNQTAASLSIDGLTNNPYHPIRARFFGLAFFTLHLDGSPGAFWDLCLCFSPSVSAAAGGFATSGGQIVNIDLLSPSCQCGGNTPPPLIPVSVQVFLPCLPILTVQMVVADPSQPDGLVLSAANEIRCTQPTLPEGFDAIPPGSGLYPLGWSDGGGGEQWAVWTGPTPVPTTGPSSGAYGPPNYIYCDTASAPALFLLNSPYFDPTGYPSQSLCFALSRVGADIGTLVVSQDDGSGHFTIPLAVYTGPAPGDWTLEVVPFNPLVPARFQFAYHATGFYGHLAIDDVALQ